MDLPYKPDFSGKVIVITGAAGVLCRVFASALAQCGAKMVVLDHTEEKVRALEREIRASGGEALGVVADVTDKQSLIRAHEAMHTAYGSCEILINGAGGNKPAATTDDEFFDRLESVGEGKKNFFDLEPAAFDLVFGLNLNGTLLPTQVFARDMAEAGKGVILNISSMAGENKNIKMASYASSKAAVNHLTRNIAFDLHFSGSDNRRVRRRRQTGWSPACHMFPAHVSTVVVFVYKSHGYRGGDRVGYNVGSNGFP